VRETPAALSSLQVLDLDRLDRIGEREAEDARVEVQLAVERALDVLGLAEAVLLALEGDVGDGQLFTPERLDHQLGLVRRHDLVFEALKENDGARQAFSEVDGGALVIQIRAFGVRADEPVEVARLELVRVADEDRQVADAEVARSGLESVAEGERV